MDDYRIVVVDDERIVRDAIANHIEWNRYDINVVGSCANAMEAMDLLNKNKVDLMLVDIQMPVINGLELIKKIRRNNTVIDFIVISGYAEFSYAQEALHYGVTEYLVKPIIENSLVEAVLRCRDKKKTTQFAKDISDKVENDDNGDRLTSKYSETVTDIIRIVNEELSNEELSLKWISSEKLFLSENYLSRLFQKETGSKFSAYLLETRMTKAMKMIANNNNLPVQDIASECGFGENPQYFSISFKKFTGYTPSQYKHYIGKI